MKLGSASLFLLISMVFAPLMSWGQDLVLQKDDFEKNLTIRLEKALAPISETIQMSIYVQTNLKNGVESKPQSQPVGGGIFLEKLGLVAPPEVFNWKKEETFSALREAILGVDISIVIPKSAPANTEKEVESVAKRVLSGLGKIPNKLKIEKSDFLKENKTPEAAAESNKPYLLPLTVLFSIFSLIGLFFWASKAFLAVENKKVEAMENQSSSRSYTPQAAEVHGQKIQSPSAGPTVFDGLGVRSLRHLARKDKMRLVQILKSWLRTDDLLSNQATIFCGQYLGFDLLEPLLSLLDEADREQWRNFVASSELTVPKDEIDQFVSKQIAESVMSQSDVDKEAREGLYDLTPQEGVQIASLSPELGAVLVNCLPGLQASRLMSLLEEKILRDVVKASLTFDKKNSTQSFGQIIKIKNEIRSGVEKSTNHFVKKAFDFIKDLDSPREKAFYDTLISANKIEECKTLAHSLFPFFLIETLSAPTLKNVLNSMSVIERSEIILTFEGSSRNTMISCYGETGKLRELLDMQLEQMSFDIDVKRKVEQHKSALQKKLLARVRGYLRATPEGISEAEVSVGNWLKKSSAGGHRAAA